MIKENLGNLTDLESLWQGRLPYIISAQRPELRITHLLNTKTDLANHNKKPLDELLSDFGQVRAQTMSILQTLDEGIILKAALHPRLKTPMRTIDHFLFVAEHDDHHLARITELARLAEVN